MTIRTQTRQLRIGSLNLGHSSHVLIQSMCNTHTRDVDATVAQINRLAAAGCEYIRVSVMDMKDAQAIAEIKKRISIPLVADIHFDHQLALAAIAAGADKIRLNPGNIGSRQGVEEVVAACQKQHLPIRIGINSGSIEKRLLEKYGHNCAEAMLESAQGHIDILEQMGFHDICLSFKSSDVPMTIKAYRLASQRWDYPLHLGLTEAGTLDYSLIKSSAALGALLNDGIGDTIRISISSDPIEEVKAAKKLLRAFGLIDGVPDLIGCPTCGRTQYDMLPIIDEIDRYLETIHSDIKVAVMGCAVNGPGEARDADIGVAGGRDEALLFRKGVIIKKIPQDQVVKVLKDEIRRYLESDS